jgi:hypothetical protein
MSLVEAERNREVARQIERADERSHHRVRDENLAQMTAFNGKLLQDMAARPQSLPAALAPPIVSNVNNVSNVTNIQHVTPTSYVTNLQANLYQTTHNLHQNTLNFINNTSNKIIAMGGALADKSEEIFQPIMNGGAPPPPPRGGERIRAIRDRPAEPLDTGGASSSGLNGGPIPLPPPTPALPPPPIRDKPIVIRKPYTPEKPIIKDKIVIKKPLVIKPAIKDIVIPPRQPQRVRPKNRELLEILDAFGDDPPSKRPKVDSRTDPGRELASRIQNRLRIMPA